MLPDHDTDKTFAEESEKGTPSTAGIGDDAARNDVDPRQVLRKLDVRLVSFVSLLFVLNFLDRTNIGNAKVAGLSADLHLTGLQYSLCAAIFFVPYCLFEVPSNLALKAISPSKWIPIIMFCWGSVMVSMAFVKSFATLLTARIFLGVTEAGLLPGVTLYLCIWYPKGQQAKRIAILSGSSSVAGAFGGLLAFAIEKMKGIGRLAGWSWIFLLEGLLTCVVAVIAYFTMHDYPETASFLTEREREWLVTTLKADNANLSNALHLKFLWQAFRDPHSYLLSGLYFFVFVPSFSFTLFLPTIISSLGFSASHAQLLTVPPNICGALFTVLSGILSDRFRAGYAATVVAACGIYPCVACILAWTGANMGGEVKRGVVLAMVIGCGNLGGIVASFIYRPQDSPRYHLGHGINIACLCISAAICAAAILEFSRLNRRKTVRCAQEGITEEKADEFHDMGDASPLYRYIV
ncbi:major facilitator superfamily domain-containing protein [Trametes polyzona]|nr:major facilitator superfamily domain-containing protein [Trametes polyzona]